MARPGEIWPEVPWPAIGLVSLGIEFIQPEKPFTFRLQQVSADGLAVNLELARQSHVRVNRAVSSAESCTAS